MNHLVGFAAELEALSHRALKLPLGSRNPETVFIARQELAIDMRKLAAAMRRRAEPVPAPSAPTDRPTPIQGMITDRNGNRIPVVHRRRRPLAR